MAIDLFKEASKYFSLEAVDIDNWSFKLFSKVTVGIFVASAMFSAASSYSGKAISCKGGEEYAEQFCWLHGTRKYPDECPGGSESDEENHNTEYYLWVSMVLFLNGVLFMIPDKLWRYFEDGMLEQFGSNKREFLDDPKIDRSENENQNNGNIVNITNDGANASNSHGSNTRPNHGKHVEIFKKLSKKLCRKYFYTFVACEMLNIVIAITSFVFTNAFLSGHFYTYGSNVVSFGSGYDTTNDPMCSLFPTVVSCTYTLFGPSGALGTRNDVCILGQNILNQKIYFFLWLWFMVLFFVSGYIIIDRIMCTLMPWYQRQVIASHLKSTKSIRVENLKNFPHGIGRWFVLAQLGRNSCPYKYRNFLEKLGERLENENTRRRNQRVGNQDDGSDANIAINGANGITMGDSNIVETTGSSQNQVEITIDGDNVGNNSDQANGERIELRPIAEE